MTKIRPSQRIAGDLREQITRGDYRPGQQLPSGTALMERYSVARQTVQNAIDQLRAEGLVVSRSGAGVFVREPSGQAEDLPRTHVDRANGGYIVERVNGRLATAADASSAGASSGTVVFAITRTTFDGAGNTRGEESIVVPAEQYTLVYEAPAG